MNIMTKRGSLDNVITYEHYCDTVADLANIPKNQITLGSVAIVLKGEDDELEVYMADTNKNWYPLLNNAGGGGSGSLADIVYICGEGDYDPSTLQPTIEDPEENVFYLVPSGDSSPNMFEEWIYTNEAWEKFGSVGGGIQSDWEQNDSTALDYIENRPFYEESETTTIYLFDSDATMTVTDGATKGTVTVNNIAKSIVEIFVNASSRILTVNNNTVALQTKVNSYPYFFSMDNDGSGRILVQCSPVSGSEYTLYNITITYNFNSSDTLAPGDYSVNVKTSSTTTTIHKIDPKFIPDITETSSSFTIGTSLTIGSTSINEAQLQELLGFTSAEGVNF